MATSLSQIEALIGEIETLPDGELKNNFIQQANQLYAQYEQEKAATEQKGREQAETYGAGGAFAEKALDMLSAGHGAEIQAGLQSLIPKEAQHLIQAPISEIVPALMDEKKYAELEKKYPGADYTELRDEIEARLRAYKELNPQASMAGNVVGLLAGAKGLNKILPAAPTELTKAAFLQAAKQGAGIGAAMGALQDPGSVYGEVSPLQAKDRAIQAAIGGAGGVALSPFAHLAGYGFGKGVDQVKEFAAKKALKATGRFTPTEMMGIPESKQIEMGQKILDEGIIGNVPRSQQTLLNRVSKNVDKTGKKLGQLVDDVAEVENALKDQGFQVGVRKQDIAKELQARLIDETEMGSPEINAAVAKEIDHFLNASKGKGPEGILSIKETQGLLSKANQRGKDIMSKVRRNGYESLTTNEKVLLEKQNILKDAVSDAAEGVANFTNQPSLANEIAATKKSYHLGKLVEQSAKRELGHELTRSGISLAPKIAVATSDAGVEGLLKGAVLQGIQDYGPQVMAKQASNLATALSGANPQYINQPISNYVYELLKEKNK